MSHRLCKHYRGPIFVTDIDETLRNNNDKGIDTIPQARQILWHVSRMGVPILYLTAAEAQPFRTLNRSFLQSFPMGILWDRPPGDDTANEDFKSRALRFVARRYPHATFVCMGDNLTGDAIAYQVCHGPSFIRQVSHWHQDNTPHKRKRRMYVYDDYTQSVRKSILREVQSLQPPTSPTLKQTVLHLPGSGVVLVGRFSL